MNLSDYTFNPWREKAGTRVVAAESYWRQPVRWNRDAEKAGVRRRVFCASMGDVFEAWDGPMVDTNGNVLDSVRSRPMTATSASSYDPLTMSDVRARLFRLIDDTPWLDWLVLTKRPENVLRMWPKGPPHGMGKVGNWPRLNVWLGVTVESQAQADARIPHLLKVPAEVRFLSCEPLLEAVDLSGIKTAADIHTDALRGVYTQRCDEGVDHPAAEQSFDGGPKVHWVIVGGESGGQARPFDVAWARSLRDQCAAAGVAFFMKQLGANVLWDGMQGGYGDGPSDCWPQRKTMEDAGGKWRVRLRDRAGADPAEWPEDIRIQEFPVRRQASPRLVGDVAKRR